MKAGIELKDTVFLFADTQIVWEAMLEVNEYLLALCVAAASVLCVSPVSLRTGHK